MKSKCKYLILILLLTAIMIGVNFYKFSDTYYGGDTIYGAQVARNVMAGKGYVTSEMPLYAINLYQKLGLSLDGPWLNTHRFVLPVYLDILFIKTFGNNIKSVTFFYDYLFFFLTIILIYFLGLKIWPDKPALAFLAAFVSLINPLVLGSDVFVFFVFLYVMNLWKESDSKWYLLLAGLVSGAAFLSRYNYGLFIVAAFLAMLYFLVFKQRKQQPLKILLKQFIGKYLVYFSGFLAVVVGFVIWNLKNTGHVFLSINGLFQLFHDTRFYSYIDGWYKLEYIFPTDNPFGYLFTHRDALVAVTARWFKYAISDIIRLISFQGILWWPPLVFGYFMISRKIKDDSLKTVNFLLWIVFILTFFQIIILPIWAGGVGYFMFLFPIFSFPIAYVLYFTYQKFAGFSIFNGIDTISFLKKIGNNIFGKTTSENILNIILIILILTSFIFLIYPLPTAIAQFLGTKGSPLMVLIIFCFILFLILGAIFVSLNNYSKLLFPTFLLIGMSYLFIVRVGIFNDISGMSPKSRWDLEDNFENIKLLEKTGNNGVILSLAPWNVVWWSANKLKSLPIPEYPDEVYLLETKYNQKIDAIYLNKINKYVVQVISYPWSAYQRAVNFGYTFDGFKVSKRLLDTSGIILERDKNFRFPLSTDLIDFGKESASSHLIWGWGENLKDGDRDYVSAGEFRYLMNKDEYHNEDIREVFGIFMESGVTYKPNVEVTFLASDNKKPNKIEIALKSLVEKQNMELILNGNLLYVGQPGVDLGNFNISTKWQKLVINIDSQKLNNGTNKLSFVFAATRKGVPPEEDQFALFDYIKFYGD
ncbi:MAG: glycosyltransferase family 39 protein [Patescibacteria group bacterium]|nr:glycosyltransferase family 39 protein [Patescibacteria group bacterium]